MRSPTLHLRGDISTATAPGDYSYNETKPRFFLIAPCERVNRSEWAAFFSCIKYRDVAQLVVRTACGSSQGKLPMQTGFAIVKFRGRGTRRWGPNHPGKLCLNVKMYISGCGAVGSAHRWGW